MADIRLCQVQETGVRCIEEAESFWDAGCEHEHITAGIGVCGEHVWRMTGRPWNCTVCQKADGHKCPVVIREVARA